MRSSWAVAIGPHHMRVAPSPVNEVDGYFGLLRVSPIADTDTSYVERSSSWRGKDQETAEFFSPIYVAMLADLKNKFK